VCVCVLLYARLIKQRRTMEIAVKPEDEEEEEEEEDNYPVRMDGCIYTASV